MPSVRVRSRTCSSGSRVSARPTRYRGNCWRVPRSWPRRRAWWRSCRSRAPTASATSPSRRRWACGWPASRIRATSARWCAARWHSGPTGSRSGPGSADPYHPRATRAAMGATFAIPLLEGVRGEDLASRGGFRVVAAVVAGGRAPWDADLRGPIVIALGGEREGLAPGLAQLGDRARDRAGHDSTDARGRIAERRRRRRDPLGRGRPPAQCGGNRLRGSCSLRRRGNG